MFQRDFVLHGAQGTGWFLFLLLVVALGVLCVALLYRYERRLVPRPLGYLLLTLRVLAVLIVFAALLEPVFIWSVDREKTGRVVVAVDVSQSMETADRHASSAEKLRLARALGMIGSEETSERLDRWVEAFENGEEPEWVSPAEAQDPQRARQLAAARRENLEGVFREVEQLPRTQVVERLLTGGESPLIEQIDDLALLELSVFAGETARTEPAALPDLISAPPESLRADSSDLTQPANASLTGNADAPLAGIVLFTDGRDNANPQQQQLLSRLRGSGVPVHTVLIGSEEKPKDLAIAGIDAPTTVYQDDQIVVKVSLRTAGFEGEPLTVSLRELEADQAEPANQTEQGDAPEAVLTETVTPGGPTATVEFPIEADELGRRRYVVDTDVQEDETRDDNNRRTFSFHVVDDESDVLLIEGEGRWEFRYIDAALRRDEHVNLDKVVFRQPYMGVLPDTFFPRTLELPADVVTTAETPFGEFDAVIVGDVASHQLTELGWELLDRFVREEGGTLVLIPGRRHMPLAYRSPVLDGLLPVQDLNAIELTGEDQKRPPTERGFRLQITPDGEAETMLQFDPDEIENRRIWSSLPGHAWGLRGIAKPGCTVWATALRPGDAPDLQGERENAVIVQQYLGAGQVLWMGIDSTWRWRHRVGDEYHHRFWGQLARWAAEFKATVGNDFVRFGPERPTVEDGEDALFRARWTEQFLRRFPDLTARAEVTRIDDPDQIPVMAVDLTPVETRPLVHEGRASGLPGGEYRVRLIVENADFGGQEISTELTVTERVTSELSELSANRNLLQQISDATGGRLFFPHEVYELPHLFHDVTETESLREEVSLWDHWLTLLLFCGVLGTEWVLRKLNGLP
ncbi:MAG: VWA domain-containing protein [Planctomycetota bacterium]|nr:MAG: VWA domain-containing protein [Planctomycetota bacterium]